jgi:hypothetical protein
MASTQYPKSNRPKRNGSVTRKSLSSSSRRLQTREKSVPTISRRKTRVNPDGGAEASPQMLSIVTNQVTLKKIVDSPQGKILTIDKLKTRREFDKQIPAKMASTLLEALWMTAVSLKDVPHNKKPKPGWKGLLKNRTRSKTSLCSNCGGERIFKMPEPNGLGKGSPL